MVRVKKRNKRTRIRGSRTLGTGFRKKKKHSVGGGSEWSGTGKRGSHKLQKAQQAAKKAGFKSYFGRQGMTSASTAKKRTEQINLRDIKANFFKKDGDKINLAKHKILGEGEGFKAEITALAASASAIEKMNKAGGKIILKEKSTSEKKVEKKTEVKSDGKEEVEVKKPAKKKVSKK